jgi:hypothetical protein
MTCPRSPARKTFDFRPSNIVITGFNTDIEHDGVVYHVQTEDKGLDSPLILSLVYSGGAILASKRSRYEDLIAAGFDEEVLTKRLKRQHRLICAAINAGRLEELKRMGAKPEAEEAAVAPTFNQTAESAASNEQALSEAAAAEAWTLSEPPAVPEAPPVTEAPVVEGSSAVGDDTLEEGKTPRKRRKVGAQDTKGSAYTVYDPRRRLDPDQVMGAESGLLLTILNDDEFLAGESYTIRALLEDRSGGKQKPLSGVGVSVKILGTAFRPQIYSVKADTDGVAVVSVTLPEFSSGRAAVLVRAVVKGQLIEVRRLIHPTE